MIRVAVADDHPLYRKGLSALMAELPDMQLAFEVDNPQDLVERLTAQPAHVVLLEMALAEAGGIDVVRDIRRHFEETVRVVVLSSEGSEAEVTRMIRSGIAAFLRKDSPFEEIVASIRAVFTTGYYFNDLLSADRLRRQVSETYQRPQFMNGIHLSDREREVLSLICQQYTNNEIADTLRLSSSTVHGYRNSLLIKTGAKNTAGLVMYAVGSGII